MPTTNILTTLRKPFMLLLIITLISIVFTIATLHFLGQGKLLTIDYSGGLCPEGICSSTIVIMKDGTTYVNNQTRPPLKNQQVKELIKLINSVNFNIIKAKEFTGICPTAFDGQEVIYTFYTTNGTKLISSCQVEIDYQSPLFSNIIQITNNLQVQN